MYLHNIHSPKNYNTTFGKKVDKHSAYIKNGLETDCFECSSKSKKAKNPKKRRLSLLALAAVFTVQTACAKMSTFTNAYSDIGSAVINLEEFSDKYFNEYNNSDEISSDVKKAVDKADFYSGIPIIGSYVSADTGMELIRNAVADEGNEVNGYIDNDVAQGIVSDCWLITPIENLSYTPIGAKLLHDALSVNEDGNIDVYFAGPNLTYTVTTEEIENANKEYSIYSRGDDDMLVYELAVEKFRQDLADDKIEIDKNLPSYLYYTNTDGYSPLRLGETRQAYWLITGITDSIEAKTEDEIDEVLEEYKENPETSLLDVELKKDAKVKDIDGNAVYIYGSHGYGVKEITDDTITLICASYSDKEIVLSLDTLKELPIDCLIYCSLN